MLLNTSPRIIGPSFASFSDNIVPGGITIRMKPLPQN
jgi:hypothetical protein